MRLILTRHGQTEGNVKLLLADENDPLTEKGRRQAAALAERLKDEPLDAIFASPYPRARQTAEVVVKYHPDIPLVIVDDLRENDIGSYLNKRWDEVDWVNLPPDIETRTSLYERGKKVVRRALEEYPDGTVLCVGHNGIGKGVVRYLKGLDPEDKRKMYLANTSVTVFEVSHGDIKEMVFNDTEHLRGFITERRCIIVHGCPDDEKDVSYAKHWIPYVKKVVESKGLTVSTPLMPEPWRPDYGRFKAAFEKLPVDEETVLVGHSCGCSFLLRWLGETKKRVARLILVAPWKVDDVSDGFRNQFYGFTIDRSIRQRIPAITYFTADDEKPAGKESLRIIHDSIGGDVRELKGHGHFTSRDMGTEEFPELVEEILRP